MTQVLDQHQHAWSPTGLLLTPAAWRGGVFDEVGTRLLPIAAVMNLGEILVVCDDALGHDYLTSTRSAARLPETTRRLPSGISCQASAVSFSEHTKTAFSHRNALER